MKPGGWVQIIEIYFNVQSDNGSITDRHALRRWSTQYLRALEDKKDLRIGSRLRGLFTGAGLEDVDSKMIPLPLSAWPTGGFLGMQFLDQMLRHVVDVKARTIGQSNSENIHQILRSLALYPLTQRLHMSKEAFDSLVEQAQREANDVTLKAYFPL